MADFLSAPARPGSGPDPGIGFPLASIYCAWDGADVEEETTHNRLIYETFNSTGDHEGAGRYHYARCQNGVTGVPFRDGYAESRHQQGYSLAQGVF
jgi:hypothetical protein